MWETWFPAAFGGKSVALNTGAQAQEPSFLTTFLLVLTSSFSEREDENLDPQMAVLMLLHFHKKSWNLFIFVPRKGENQFQGLESYWEMELSISSQL